MKHRNHYRRCVVIIWVAIFTGLLIAFLGLAMDHSHVGLVARQLQNGADAAALAGAQLVKTDVAQARIVAQEIGATNLAYHDPILLDLNDVWNNTEGDIVVGRYLAHYK